MVEQGRGKQRMVRVEEGSSEWLTPYNCIEAAAGPTDSGSVLRTTVKSADEVRYDSRANPRNKGKQAGEQKRLIVAELVEKHREYNREGKRTQD